MKIDSSADLLAFLAETCLLGEPYLKEVRHTLLAKHSSAFGLAAELVESRRLTSYQAEQILEGHGNSLVLEGYRILEPLGQGGMGQVFKAEQARLGRIVALKVINPECLSKSPEAIRRFQRESRAAAQLCHPNVITIYDAGQDGETYFLVMEYTEGIDLANLVQQCGPLPVASACDYISQAALGLQHAHERGLIHRDIKPSNILITGSPIAARTMDTDSPSGTALPYRFLHGGLAKVLDMGLARLDQSSDKPVESALTEAGKLVGTPDYIAPEQARDARHADGRADIYSLGCTFYFVLTGRHPFPEGNLIEKLLMHQLDEPEPVETGRPDVPSAVTAIVRKMMAKQPQARYQSPVEVAQTLSSLKLPLAGTSPVSAAPNLDTVSGESQPTQVTPVQPLVVTQLLASPLSPSPVKRPTPPPDDTRADRASMNSWTGEAKSEQPVPLAAPKLAEMNGHRGCALALAFAPDRNTLASAGVDGTIRLWDFSQGKPREVAALAMPAGEATSLVFAPDQKTLIAGASTGKLLRWDLAGTAPRLTAMGDGHRQAVAALAISPDGRSLLSGGAERVHLWSLDGERPQQRATLQGHQGNITAVGFAPNSPTVATAGHDGTVRFWEPRRLWNREQTILRVSRSAVSSIAFSTDSGSLACGTLDKAFHLCDRQGDEWRSRPGFGDIRSNVRLVLFRQGAQTLVTVEDAGRACVWEPESGALLEEWTVPVAMAYCYALTCDGRYLATGRSDGTIAVYRIGTKRASR